ncbi:MAG: SH3 domain-containing protein [Bacillota bacterium]
MYSYLPPRVTAEMLDVEFWLNQAGINADKILLDADAIEAYQERTYGRMERLELAREYTPFVYMRKELTQKEVKGLMAGYSLPAQFPQGQLYAQEGSPHPKVWRKQIIDNLNLDLIPDVVSGTPALTTARVSIRAFPTTDIAARSPESIDVDLFQLTALPAASPVQIWHIDKSQNWAFVQSEIYSGWVQRNQLALASTREEVISYLKAQPRLVVTGSHLETEPNPFRPEIGGLFLQQGDSLPLAADPEVPAELPEGSRHGQAPTGCYVVRVPTADPDTQKLEFSPALIAGSASVQTGYSHLTRRSLLTAAFKSLGERYGWGGLFHRRDCSRLVFDIYRQAGMLLPRDAGRPQEEGAAGEIIEFSGGREERLRQLQAIEPGDPLYLPGHVMVYLGEVDGGNYVIHAGAGYGLFQNEEIKPITVHSVFVMELETHLMHKNKTYLEALTCGRKFYRI